MDNNENKNGFVSGFDENIDLNNPNNNQPTEEIETKEETEIEDTVKTEETAEETAVETVTEELKPEPASFSPDINSGYSNAAPYQTVKPQTKEPPKKPQKAKFSAATVVVSVILSLLVGLGSSFLVLRYAKTDNNTTSSGNSTVTTNKIVSTSEKLGVVEAVYKSAGDSVVGVRTTVNANSFFESSGEGSGVIYSEDGYIITNYHVIAGSSSTSRDGSTVYSGVASKIDVYLSGDTTNAISAKVVGYNSSYDIAVLKINKKGLSAVKIGNSDKLNVGQFVVAIGNPGGLQFMSSVTYGVIGGLNRTLQVESETIGLIQTDAAINPGNSGGALVDTSGNLIGINSSKLVDTSYEGMGFAIPINDVVDICKKIINNENSASPYIGIEVSTAYDSDTLKALGFPAGAVVSSVTSDSPAEKAGLKRADIITSFNGKSVDGYEKFRSLLSSCKPDETVPIEIYRSGQTYKTTITIGTNNQVD